MAIFELVTGIGCFLTTFFYHLSEALHHKMIGLEEGQWHRLDNVGAIMILCVLPHYLLTPLEKSRREQMLPVFQAYEWGICLLAQMFRCLYSVHFARSMVHAILPAASLGDRLHFNSMHRWYCRPRRH